MAAQGRGKVEWEQGDRGGCWSRAGARLMVVEKGTAFISSQLQVQNSVNVRACMRVCTPGWKYSLQYNFAKRLFQ